jgi:hypothetical protein
MTEGELKKQLRDILVEETGSTDKKYISGLLKPLDEAAKEYPRWQIPTHAPNQYPTIDELAQSFSNHSMKVISWFEKWFGSEQK